MKTKAATSAKRAAVAKKKASRRAGKAFSAKVAYRPYEVVAKTYDGVSILRPKTRPKHFTSKQIRETIIEVKNAASD